LDRFLQRRFGRERDREVVYRRSNLVQEVRAGEQAIGKRELRIARDRLLEQAIPSASAIGCGRCGDRCCSAYLRPEIKIVCLQVAGWSVRIAFLALGERCARSWLRDVLRDLL